MHALVQCDRGLGRVFAHDKPRDSVFSLPTNQPHRAQVDTKAYIGPAAVPAFAEQRSCLDASVGVIGSLTSSEGLSPHRPRRASEFKTFLRRYSLQPPTSFLHLLGISMVLALRSAPRKDLSQPPKSGVSLDQLLGSHREARLPKNSSESCASTGLRFFQRS
jgi:hypothetical protein